MKIFLFRNLFPYYDQYVKCKKKNLTTTVVTATEIYFDRDVGILEMHIGYMLWTISGQYLQIFIISFDLTVCC
jgi:hypothetical protein